jgi:hypothetical protein
MIANFHQVLDSVNSNYNVVWLNFHQVLDSVNSNYNVVWLCIVTMIQEIMNRVGFDAEIENTSAW